MKKGLLRILISGPARGFTLIEMIVAGAVISVAGLALATLFTQQYANVKYMEAMADLDTYHQDLRQKFGDVKNCTATFSSSINTKTIGTDLQELKRCTATNSTECDPANPGSYGNQTLVSKNDVILSRNFEIQNFIVNPSSSTPNTGTPLSGTGLRILTINVQYRVNNSNLKGGKQTILKPIMVHVKFASNGDFKQCTSEADGAGNSLEQIMCETLGSLATYSSDESRCTLLPDAPDQVCPPGRTYRGMKGGIPGTPNVGMPDCQPFIAQVPPPIIADPTQTDCSPAKAISFVAAADGRIRVECAGGSPPACTQTDPCSTVMAATCTGTPAVDNCGASCGLGTKICIPPACVPASNPIDSSQCCGLSLYQVTSPAIGDAVPSPCPTGMTCSCGPTIPNCTETLPAVQATDCCGKRLVKTVAGVITYPGTCTAAEGCTCEMTAPAVDCSAYEVSFNEINRIFTAVGAPTPWTEEPANPLCECQEQPGDIHDFASTYAGPGFEKFCRQK